MIPDWLQLGVGIAGLASALVALVGVLVVNRQLKLSKNTLLGGTSQFCYETMNRLLEILIDKPQLRPFLYEGVLLESISDSPDLQQQVIAISAYYADFFDAILLQQSLGNVHVEEYLHVWKGFIATMLITGPTIRSYCLQHPSWYSPELVELARLSLPAGSQGVSE
jgi:hypothetical protein